MKMTQKFFWGFLWIGLQFAFAQQETQFWLSPYQQISVNPSLAGFNGTTQLLLHSNSQWTTIEDSPQTFAFSFSLQTDKKLGWGINIVSDNVFVEKQTHAFLDFSYPLQLSENLFLSLGLKAGGNFYNSAAQNLRSTSIQFDPAQRTISSFRPNVGAGLYLQHSKFWVSLAQPRLINARLDQSEWVQAQDRVHTYLAMGSSLSILKDWKLKPSIQLQKVKSLPSLISYSALLSFQNKIEGGFSYRSSGELGFLAFLPVSDSISFGYAYAQPGQSSLAGLQTRSHEILLKINLNKFGGTEREAFQKE